MTHKGWNVVKPKHNQICLCLYPAYIHLQYEWVYLFVVIIQKLCHIQALPWYGWKINENLDVMNKTKSW